MPKVSIVMPTRNRAHLLKTSLGSALRQTYKDLEVLVSDNYCENESTRKVCEELDTPKLRYVRTDKLLSMPDSWEFAVGQAQGEYVTVLTDDSYLFPDAIETAMAELGRFDAKIASWCWCAYYAPDWLDRKQRNVLIVPKVTFRSRSVPSSETIKRLFDLDIEHVASAPKFLNSLCHRESLDRVVRLHKRIFLPPCPDFSAALELLQVHKEYLFIDRPLFVDGKFPASIGAVQSFNYGDAAREFYKEFSNPTEFTKLIDLNIKTETVNIAQSFQNVISSCSKDLPDHINMRNLVCRSVRELVVNEKNGGNVSEAWRALNEYLAKQPRHLQKAAARQKARSIVRSNIKTILMRTHGWDYVRRFRGDYPFSGRSWGFKNLEECGAVAPELVEKVAGGSIARRRPPGSLKQDCRSRNDAAWRVDARDSGPF